MAKSPYKSPKSELETEPAFVMPEPILRKIRNAWIAALLSIVITLSAVILAWFGVGSGALNLELYALIDVLLMAILAYGIYRKSRTCAVLLFLLFAVNKIVLWMDSGDIQGMAVAAVFLWFFAQGIIGTFQFHAQIDNPEQQSPDPDED